MKVEDERGYLILAVNNSTTDYIKCAELLATTIKRWEPTAKICVLTNEIPLVTYPRLIDYYKVLPYGNTSKQEWQLDLDWQCFYASPFRETIKLEADCIVAGPIDHWFDLMRNQPVCLTTGCYDYRGDKSDVRSYRRVFDDNNLLDIYNAITYWRLSIEAKEFFLKVKHIFNNWDQYMSAIKGGATQEPNTDLAYAIAAELLGRNKFYIPNTTYPQFVHMKPDIANTPSDWYKSLTWEFEQNVFRVNGYAQKGLVHYHDKHLAGQFRESIFNSTKTTAS